LDSSMVSHYCKDLVDIHFTKRLNVSKSLSESSSTMMIGELTQSFPFSGLS